MFPFLTQPSSLAVVARAASVRTQEAKVLASRHLREDAGLSAPEDLLGARRAAGLEARLGLFDWSL